MYHISYSQVFRTTLISSFLLCSLLAVNAQQTDKKLDKILLKSKELKPVLSQKDKYEVQIIYTQIDRDSQNRPKFTTYNFNVDSKRYFYPASTVKLPAVLLSLEKINKLNINGLTKETPLVIGKAFEGHEAVSADQTSEDGNASVANYAKKILLVSDNDAFNRLYEFMGQEPFNETLKSKGYRNLRIVHRLSIPYSREENAITPQINFGITKAIPKVPPYAEPDRMEVAEKSSVFTQEAQKNTSRIYAPNVSIRKGKGYQKGDEIINEPFDFTNKNFYALTEQHELMKALMFPDAVSPIKRFDLTEADYAFVYKYMSMLPKETTFPNYNTSEYWDSYVKFFMFGDNKKPMPKNIRIFNKVGDAYGYLIDNAYIVDFENNVEFILSAVIHVNENQIYNDGVYEYDQTGFPFMAELGKTIYNHELSRKKNNLPNLSRFKLAY